VLKIRLRRMGTRQDACYRIVVSDGRSTPGGRFVDVLGTYDPGVEPRSVKIDVERAQAWIRKGAHPSNTVRSLIARALRAESSLPA
jgi:small subunit ribosomal protein S16